VVAGDGPLLSDGSLSVDAPLDRKILGRKKVSKMIATEVRLRQQWMNNVGVASAEALSDRLVGKATEHHHVTVIHALLPPIELSSALKDFDCRIRVRMTGRGFAVRDMRQKSGDAHKSEMAVGGQR
jgi:hypothetical protein